MSTGEGHPSQSLIAALAEAVVGALAHRPRLLLGIDGPDGAGKTTLADALGQVLGDLSVRASLDGFHHPREHRLRRGPLSPAGYYADSFDYDRLRADLLVPFRDGARDVRTRVFDHRTDASVESRERGVREAAVLVFDGVFLLRPEVRDFWDVSVYLHVPPEETIRRVVVRDQDLFGTVGDVVTRYEQRYLPGQALYRDIDDPQARATVVVDNSLPDAPVVLRWGLPGNPP